MIYSKRNLKSFSKKNRDILQSYKFDDNLKNLIQQYVKVSGFDFTSSSFIKQEDYWTTIPSSITDDAIIGHFLSFQSIGTNPYKYSKYLIFDIDQRNNNKDIKEFIVAFNKDFNINPFFLEYSPFSKGYHVYYSLNTYINDSTKKIFQKYIKETYGFEVEIISSSKRLRLPYSNEYSIGGAFDKNKPNLIDNSYSKDLEDKIENLIKLFTCGYNNQFSIALPKILKEKKYNLPQYTRKNDQSTDSITDFSYGCGTRHIMQFKIAFFCHRKELDYDTFKDLCDRYNDGTSKDMCKPFYQKEKMLEGIWKATLEYSKTSATTLYNEEHYLENFVYDKDYSIEDDLFLKLQAIGLVYYDEKNLGVILGKKHLEFANNLPIVYEAIKSKLQYEIDIHKKYTNEAFNDLNDNKITMLSQDLKQKIGDTLHIKNIQKYFQCLEDLGIMEKIWFQTPEWINSKKEVMSYLYSTKGECIAQHYKIKDSIIHNLFKEEYKFRFLQFFYCYKSKLVKSNKSHNSLFYNSLIQLINSLIQNLLIAIPYIYNYNKNNINNNKILFKIARTSNIQLLCIGIYSILKEECQRRGLQNQLYIMEKVKIPLYLEKKMITLYHKQFKTMKLLGGVASLSDRLSKIRYIKNN